MNAGRALFMFVRNLDLLFPLAILFFLFVAPIGLLQADTIYLKNGQTLTGDIIRQTRTMIEIQTTAGLKRVEKTTMRRVVFSKNETSQQAAARQAREAAVKKAKAETARIAQEQAATEAARKAEEARIQEAAADAARIAQEEAETRAAREPITRSGAIWRSLVLPGWGQYYQGRRAAAFGYGGGFAATGLWTVSNAREYQSRQSALDAAAANLNFAVVVLGAGLPFFDPDLALRPQIFGLQYFTTLERSSALRGAEEASRNFKLSTLLLGAVYIANVVDVVVFHPADDSTVGVYAAPSGAGLRFQMRF